MCVMKYRIAPNIILFHLSLTSHTLEMFNLRLLPDTILTFVYACGIIAPLFGLYTILELYALFTYPLRCI